MLCFSCLFLIPLSAHAAEAPGKPIITNQPTGIEMTVATASFELVVTATSPDSGTLTYQWYRTTINEISTIMAIDEETNLSYSPPQTVGTVYYCVAVWNNQDGIQSEPVYSNLVKVTFTEPPPHVHSYGPVMVTTQPTCTEPGITVAECDCGDELVGEIPALGHSFGAWKTVVYATCSTEGIQIRECSRCGLIEHGSIPATDEHLFGSWIITIPATCVTEGEQSRECYCGEVETEIIPATGQHVFGAWTTTIHPSCTTEGLRSRTCTICNEEVTEIIAALGHTWNSGVLVTPATSSTEGVAKYTCITCGEVRLEVLPPNTSQSNPDSSSERPNILWLIPVAVAVFFAATFGVLLYFWRRNKARNDL